MEGGGGREGSLPNPASEIGSRLRGKREPLSLCLHLPPSLSFPISKGYVMLSTSRPSFLSITIGEVCRPMCDDTNKLQNAI